MLTFRITALLRSPPGAVLDIPLSEPRPDFGPELSRPGPVRGRARLQRTQRGVIASVEAATSVQCECSRCLESFHLPIRVAFEEEFRYLAPDQPRRAAEEDAGEGFQIGERQLIDLGEAIRQYVSLGLPLAPVCRPDCPGLCPACGQPLDRGQHDHRPVPAPAASPFARLAELYGPPGEPRP